MIKLIPTNHLMKKEEIYKILEKEKPDLVAIELCEARVNAIVSNQLNENLPKNGLLNEISDSIRKKAQEKNLDYGSDMKAALEFSFDNKLKYIPVDMPILKINELFQKIPDTEKEGFAKELAEFQAGEISNKVDEEAFIKQLNERYPVAFEFLTNMRNLYIANQLLLAEKTHKNKKIVAILGSAHFNSVNKLIGGKLC